MAEIQLPAQKIGAIVVQRDVYSGPQGSGYIDREFRMNGAELEEKATHIGPEARPSFDYTPRPDQVRIEKQITGTTPENLKVVKKVETPPGSGNFQEIIVQEVHNVPVYGDVPVTHKHPYKAQFFGV